MSDSESRRTVLQGAQNVAGVAIVDGYIEDVGAVVRHSQDRIIDCTDTVLTPGLVNTHHHLFQTCTRGYATCGGLQDWLTALYPLWGQLTPTQVRCAAVVALSRLALSGCTTTVDHHYLVINEDDSVFDAIVDAARQVGIRLHLVRGGVDRGRGSGGTAPDSFVESIDTYLTSVASFADRVHDGERICIAVGPGNPLTVSEDLLRESSALAADYGLGQHTHFLETASDREKYEVLLATEPIELLARTGWLEGRAWLGHAIHLNDQDIALLAESGTGVAHCPSSNARLGSGICPVGDLLAHGVSVGLGVDGAASSEDGGLLPELKMAFYLSRLRQSSQHTLSPGDAMSLATEGGASCLHRTDIGALRPGMRADIAVWPADDLSDMPDVSDGLVLGQARTVRHLFVGGRQVVCDGHVTTVDTPAAQRDLAKAAIRLRNGR